jgi:ATP/maltotriose-dependent transcriptional regulator MalT
MIRRDRYWTATAFFHFLDRDLPEALNAAQRLEDSGGGEIPHRLRGQGVYLMARACILRNEFEDARKLLATFAADTASLDARIAADTLCMLSMIHELSGRIGESAAAENDLKEFARNTDDPAVSAVASSFQARLALTRGDMRSATHWMRTTDHTVGDGIMLWWFEAPRLTECRVLIAEGAKSGLREAVERLDACEREIETLYCGVHLIDILCLSALAHEKIGFTEKARQLLARASTLAERDNVVLPFAESGAPILELVKGLPEKNASGDTLQKILADFSAEGSLEGNRSPFGART